jgi:hypothetical protein
MLFSRTPTKLRLESCHVIKSNHKLWPPSSIASPLFQPASRPPTDTHKPLLLPQNATFLNLSNCSLSFIAAMFFSSLQLLLLTHIPQKTHIHHTTQKHTTHTTHTHTPHHMHHTPHTPHHTHTDTHHTHTTPHHTPHTTHTTPHTTHTPHHTQTLNETPHHVLGS